MRHNRWTLRFRLTAVYTMLFLATGVMVTGLCYLILRQTLIANAPQQVRVIPSQLPGYEGKVLPDQDARAARAVADYRDLVLQDMLRKMAFVLGTGTLLAAAAGWVVAGRALRPVGEITAAARRVARSADRNLHERIRHVGPKDDLKELADTFDEMLERLDRAFESQRRFVANASHELKTPLAVNRTLVEVAMSLPDAPVQVHQLGTNLLTVLERHERIIDGLLTLAQCERLESDLRRVDLADMVTHVIDATDALLCRAGVRIETDLAPAPVVGDPVLLERLVQNLVDNAVRYNVRQGWVRVVTGTGRCGSTLTVSNSGPVIASYEVPTLFEPFRRRTVRVGSARGTGLGLSIARSVVAAHRGSITATAIETGGLTVEALLPTSQPDVDT